MAGPYLCIAKPDMIPGSKTVKVIRGTINGASAWCNSALTTGYKVSIRRASVAEVMRYQKEK